MEQDHERGFRLEDRSKQAIWEQVYTAAEHERHYAPLNSELNPHDARHFGWRAENGTVQTLPEQRNPAPHPHRGQFLNQQNNPITQEAALDRAMGAGHPHATQNSQAQELRSNAAQTRASASAFSDSNPVVESQLTGAEAQGTPATNIRQLHF